MKNYILLFSFVLFGANSAFARIDDLFFKPEKNSIYAWTDFYQGTKKYKESNTKIKTHSITESFNYGVSDNFSVITEISYLKKDIEQTSQTNNIDINFQDEGFSNPNFIFNYRIPQKKMFFDLKFAYSPKFQNAENIDSNVNKTQNGIKLDGTSFESKESISSGNNLYQFGFSFGQHRGSFYSHKIVFNTIYLEDREVKNNDNSKTTFDARTDFTYGYEFQLKLSDYNSLDFAINKLIKGTYSDNHNNIYQGGNELKYLAQYNITVKERFIISLAYQYLEIDNRLATGIEQGNLNSVTNFTDIKENIINLKIGYKF